MEACTVNGLFQVEGGRPLTGEITIRGVKNLIPRAMVTVLLGSAPPVLHDTPLICDVDVTLGLLSLRGVSIDYNQREGTFQSDPSKVESAHMAGIDTHAGSSCIPILFYGPFLRRLEEAFILNPGGCCIGDHPIDFYLEILRQSGAAVDKQAQDIRLIAPHGLKETVIELPYPSVGATEQTLPTAVRTHELTELRNAAIGSRIMDLVDVLQKMSTIISVDTDRTIYIEGVDELRDYAHSALPSCIEVVSWASATLATRGDVLVCGAYQSHMTTFLNTSHKVGGTFDITDESIRFYHPDGDLKSIVVKTNAHPGFMTDWQQPLVATLTQAQGPSIVHETICESCFDFTDALCRMDAIIQVYRECLDGTKCRLGQRDFYHSVVISGPTPLTGTDTAMPDLRGGFSHLTATLIAEDTSWVEGVNLIDRGYEYFMSKLKSLNAAVTYLV